MSSFQSPPTAEYAVTTPLAAPFSATAAQPNVERYRAIADSSFDLICELDSEGRFVYISPAFGISTGLDAATALGASFFDRVPAEERTVLIAEYTATLAGLRAGRAEHRFELDDGDSRWFESALRGIGAGEERRVVVVAREISARWRHQTELETLISLAKDIHSQHELADITLAIWQHLRALLPATALLLVLPGDERGDSLDVVGQTAQGALAQTIARQTAPDCPLWQALEREGSLAR